MAKGEALLESKAKGDEAQPETEEEVWESPNTASQFWSYTRLFDVFVVSASKTVASFHREYLHLNLVQRGKKGQPTFSQNLSLVSILALSLFNRNRKIKA